MIAFPSWLKEAMQHRFDELAVQAYHDPKLASTRTRFEKTLDQIKTQLGEPNRVLFLEWEDDNHYIHSAEKEWLYLQGVRDGAEIQIALMGNQRKPDSLL